MSPTPKRLAVLGATGSVGRQTLEVVQQLRAQGQPSEVVALAAGTDVVGLAQLARTWNVRHLGLAGPGEAQELRELLGRGVSVVHGPEGLAHLASLPEVDLVVNAVVGAAGLHATLGALRAGKTLALANKESLVIGGELVRGLVRRDGQILPLDSEHAALFQVLRGVGAAEVDRVWITASGGPFRGWSPTDLEEVKPEQALAHPTWRMGPRITIDSATLVNKAFEVIEAHHLFGFPWDRIGVVVHPQCRVHALVELADGSVVAQLSPPDMRLPIQAALTYPERGGPPWARLDLSGLSLTFERVPEGSYPGFWAVLAAGVRGGTAPVVANAVDEVLVAAFLAGKLPFPAIARGLEEILASHRAQPVGDLETVLDADRQAREEAMAFVDRKGTRV